MTRVSRTDGALYTGPRRTTKQRICDGHLNGAAHTIPAGDMVVWSALPPDNPDIGNTGWWHHVYCMACAPQETVAGSPPSLSRRALTRGTR